MNGNLPKYLDVIILSARFFKSAKDIFPSRPYWSETRLSVNWVTTYFVILDVRWDL